MCSMSTAPADEPSTIERIASPTSTALVKILAIVGVSFLTAGALQRVLLGRYAVKIGGLEVPEIPATTAATIDQTSTEATEAQQPSTDGHRPGLKGAARKPRTRRPGSGSDAEPYLQSGPVGSRAGARTTQNGHATTAAGCGRD
jgi:hypothetical protein